MLEQGVLPFVAISPVRNMLLTTAHFTLIGGALTWRKSRCFQRLPPLVFHANYSFTGYFDLRVYTYKRAHDIRSFSSKPDGLLEKLRVV